jgi:hypothetical protein
MTKSIVAALALCATAANANRILLATDEWTFSDYGYQSASGTERFAANVAQWLTSGSPLRKVAILSDNFGFGSRFEASLAAEGLEVDHALAPSDLSGYAAVFLAGNRLDNAALIDFVLNGGSVYLAAGTGWGGPDGEGSLWNPFLNYFGLGIGAAENGLNCTLAPPPTDPLFAGVSDLLFINGNDVLNLGRGAGERLLWSEGGGGLMAAYDGNVPESAPEPGSWLLLGMGLALLAVDRYRRRARSLRPGPGPRSGSPGRPPG